MNNSKVLFIRYKKPGGIKEGGEQGTHKNYLILCELFGVGNTEEYYVHPDLEHETVWDKFIGFWHILSNYYFGLTPEKVETICQIALQKDLVFIDRSIFGIIAKKLKQKGYKGQIITFFHNVEKTYYKVRMSPLAPYKPFVLRCIDTNDRYSLQYSDKTLGVNRRDSEVLKKLYGKAPNTIVPVTFVDKQPKGNETPLSDPPVCLFLGAYYPGNVRGILWFIKQVYPKVHIRMQIVGKNMDKIKPKITDNSIEIYSDVEDLQPFIENADFMVLPIFEGSGMKVKTCEALMYGKTIIGTQEAFEGYEVDFDKVGACCETKEDFIHALTSLPNKNLTKFNPYSRNFYLKNHTHEIARNRITDLIFNTNGG